MCWDPSDGRLTHNHGTVQPGSRTRTDHVHHVDLFALCKREIEGDVAPALAGVQMILWGEWRVDRVSVVSVYPVCLSAITEDGEARDVLEIDAAHSLRLKLGVVPLGTHVMQIQVVVERQRADTVDAEKVALSEMVLVRANYNNIVFGNRTFTRAWALAYLEQFSSTYHALVISCFWARGVSRVLFSMNRMPNSSKQILVCMPSGS